MSHPLRWLALVPLGDSLLPDAERVRTYLSEHFSDLGAITVDQASDGLLTCSLGEFTAAVALAPREIPWSQLEGPCQTAWYWPDASEALRDHAAHLMVALIDEGGANIEKSTRLTQLVAAVLASADARGVFWGPGRLVHPPAAFLEQSRQMSPDDLPLFLWIDFRVERVDASNVRLYTTGLEALGHEELEAADFHGEPQELLEYAYNVAHYVITGNKTIEEGHTIGLTDDAQVIAHRGKSMFDPQMDVLQLQFEVGE